MSGRRNRKVHRMGLDVDSDHNNNNKKKKQQKNPKNQHVDNCQL